MQANELRINNLIAVKGFCVKVSKETFKHIENGKVLEAEPIPLTEELLIKFGFEKSNSVDRTIEIVGRNFTLDSSTPDNYSTVKLIEWWSEDCNVIRKVKYVHQLQNLYFALTGKELTIKQ